MRVPLSSAPRGEERLALGRGVQHTELVALRVRHDHPPAARAADLRRPTDRRRENSSGRRMRPGLGGCQHVRMPQHRPDSRFVADVDYSGRAGHHDYVVHARHRLLDTTFTVVIDGVEHDPKAEEKAWKAREKEEAAQGAAQDDGSGREGPADGGSDPGRQREDDLRFTLEEGFTTLRCTVRRPREDGSHKEAEVITIR